MPLGGKEWVSRGRIHIVGVSGGRFSISVEYAFSLHFGHNDNEDATAFQVVGKLFS